MTSMGIYERYAKMICKQYGAEPPPDDFKYSGPETIAGVAKAVLPLEALARWFDDNANEDQRGQREAFLASAKG